MIRLALVAALSLSACTDKPVERAEKRLAMVERNGTSDEVCAAAKDVAEAQLDAMDEPGYRQARTAAAILCNRALLDSLD